MSTAPRIDIVIIGLNSSQRLKACLESVKSCRYPKTKISIIYADGGSTDDSILIAKSSGCICVRAESCLPTPGSQRNAGWRMGSAEYIQFIDSDTLLDKEWLGKAVLAFFSEEMGAICGDRRELKPTETIFNWIGDLEWNGRPGETETFGGDVLISRVALEATGGYDPSLIAGEDPELSYRVRRAGFKILRLGESMTKHDLAMHTLGQYLKRAYRSGYAYAEVHYLHRNFWAKEVSRILLRSVPFIVGLIAIIASFYCSPWLLVMPLVGAVTLLRPRIFLVRKFQESLSLSRREARIYAWHASLVVLPQFLGMLRFFLGRLLSLPLTNRRMLCVATGKTSL